MSFFNRWLANDSFFEDFIQQSKLLLNVIVFTAQAGAVCVTANHQRSAPKDKFIPRVRGPNKKQN